MHKHFFNRFRLQDTKIQHPVCGTNTVNQPRCQCALAGSVLSARCQSGAWEGASVTPRGVCRCGDKGLKRSYQSSFPQQGLARPTQPRNNFYIELQQTSVVKLFSASFQMMQEYFISIRHIRYTDLTHMNNKLVYSAVNKSMSSCAQVSFKKL